MVAFNDRRRVNVESLEDVAPGLPLRPGDTLSKGVYGGRFVIRGEKQEEGGREYVVHEVLPNHSVIERERFSSRHKARRSLSDLGHTNVYDI